MTSSDSFFATEYCFFLPLRESDVYMLPASGLDYVELENFRTGSEEHATEGDEHITEHTDTEDYSDEEMPRKFELL